jgi:hypothetical protein
MMDNHSITLTTTLRLSNTKFWDKSPLNSSHCSSGAGDWSAKSAYVWATVSPIEGFENMALKRISRPRTEEITGGWRFVIYTKHYEWPNQGRYYM